MSCSTFKECCTKDQKFWFEKPSDLFCSLNFIPSGGVTSGQRLNSITRMILYITIALYMLKFKFWYLFLGFSLLFIILLHFNKNDINSKDTTIKSTEYFNFTDNKMSSKLNSNSNSVTSKDYLQSPLSLYTNTRSDMSYNVTNSTRGSTEDLIHKQSLIPRGGKRDVQAGITYYTPDVGTNLRTHVPPVIGPRAYDQDVWGQSSTVFPDLNFNKTRDITELDLQLPDRQGKSTGLAVPIVYVPSQPGAVMAQNKPHQPLYDGDYPSRINDLLGGADVRDWDRDVLPLYNPENKVLYPNRVFDLNYRPESDEEVDLTLKKSEENPNTVSEKKEKFDFYNNDINNKQNNNQMNTNLQSHQLETRNILNPINSSQFNYPLASQYYNNGNVMSPQGYYNVLNRVPPGKDIQPYTQTEQLIPQSPNYVYTDKYFDQPSSKLYLQDIQPKLYSYTVDQTPLNSNIGITYAPQNPAPVMDQITYNHMAYPLYTRIDPQLVRTDGTRAQQALSPQRTNWSEEYSNFSAPPGSINFEDIYDPRFTSYGDPYRSYSDINLGQVQYYYSDVDAYRMPNFVTRSNVDFIEYRTPQGEIWPEYQRTASVDDVRSHVESQYAADDTFRREDLMSLQMSKANRRAWQQRYAPLRQQGANTQASTYGAGI